MITAYHPRNWAWDAAALSSATWKPWRGFVIIDASDGRWQRWNVGTPGIRIGDGHTLGSTATSDEIAGIRRIVARFKPAHMWVVKIVVVFDTTLFRSTNDAGAGMPAGDYGDVTARNPGAIYWGGVQ